MGLNAYFLNLKCGCSSSSGIAESAVMIIYASGNVAGVPAAQRKDFSDSRDGLLALGEFRARLRLQPGFILPVLHRVS